MNRTWKIVPILYASFATMIFNNEILGQQDANYDESKIPPYELPDLLKSIGGDPVTSADQWNDSRRAEILGLFENQMFGTVPDFSYQVTANTKSVHRSGMPGGNVDVVQRQLTIRCNEKSIALNVAIFLPGDAKRPVPVFLGYNFFGNQSVTSDPKIEITRNWVRNNAEYGVENNLATDKTRGVSKSRWPINEIIKRGYGVATLYYGDVDPDFDDGFQNGVHALVSRVGQTELESNRWGSISAWAWGLSRVLDDFESNASIDHERVIVIGHSRLGKTALWAGASDPRFAMAISNNSGCGGAALSRRAFGETVSRINTNFPHWFCRNFRRYNDNENELPVDQHMLIALLAPRPVYIASASEDRWADPKGEFLSGVNASPVYRLFNKQGLNAQSIPATDQSIGESIGYHIREGKHDITLLDWQHYLDFADRHLKQ
jgi:hypothetical protein